MKLYVAGPMTGLPEYNLPAFAEAAEKLDLVGYEAVNPGRHGADPAYTWADYMRRGLIDLLGCDGVAVLPGWQASKGATIETNLARDLGITVMTVDEWLVREVAW